MNLFASFTPRGFILGAILWFGFEAGVWLSHHYGIRFNLSESLEARIMITSKQPKLQKIQPWDIVVFSPPPYPIAYVPLGSKVAKYVACGAGESFEVRGKEYFCANHDKPLALAQDYDSQGREMIAFSYDGKSVPVGKFFATGIHDRSFDSRYFGFVDYSSIEEVVIWKF